MYVALEEASSFVPALFLCTVIVKHTQTTLGSPVRFASRTRVGFPNGNASFSELHGAGEHSTMSGRTCPIGFALCPSGLFGTSCSLGCHAGVVVLQYSNMYVQ